jgi:hypothetical protein
MKLHPDGILIRVGTSIRGQNRGWMPQTPTPQDRYTEFHRRYTARTQEIPVNNYPWKFRQIPKA